VEDLGRWWVERCGTWRIGRLGYATVPGMKKWSGEGTWEEAHLSCGDWGANQTTASSESGTDVWRRKALKESH
jgi:hypothetical protein